MHLSNSRPGQFPYETKKVRVMNRCGATALVVGDVVAFDLDASDAATLALEGVGGVTLTSLADAMFSNVIQVGAAPKNALIGVVTSLLANEGADNTEVEVAISGRVTAKIGGTDWSVANSSAGVAVIPDTTGANRRMVVAADAANRGKVGVIIAAIDADLTATNTTAEVWLIGFGSSVGSVGA